MPRKPRIAVIIGSTLLPTAKTALDELVWWANATMAARKEPATANAA